MAADLAAHRCRTWYGRLLRLYPRPFRERFGEGMAQTFHDLCREHREGQRGLFALVLGIFFETSVGIVKENIIHMPQLGKTMLHVALWSLAALMVPIVASQLIRDWNWPVGAFVFVYVLFFATGMMYAVIAKKMGVWSYKAGVGLALFAGFGLAWSNMVHVADSGNPKNFLYYAVLVVGFIGVCLARLEARGLARTLFAMAMTMALIAAFLPSGAPPDLARNMAVGHVGLVVLFSASGFLFRHASNAVSHS